MPEVLTKTATQTLRVYLSYANADAKTAQEIVDALTWQPQVQVFTPQSIKSAGNWAETIREELQASDVFIVLLSYAWSKSSNNLFEYGGAVGIRKPVLFVLPYPDAPIPEFISTAHMPIVALQDFANPETVRDLLEPYRATPALAVAEKNETPYKTAHPTP